MARKVDYDMRVRHPIPLALAALILSSVLWLAVSVAHADAPKALGSLAVNSVTIGAEVFIDGDSVGTTPLSGPLTLTAEDHTLKVTKPGFAPLIDVVKIAKHKTAKIDVDLTPVAGILRVKANITQARVFVDGKFVGEAPLETELPVGARAVSVSRGGYKDFFVNLEAVAGQENTLEVKLDELPADINPYKQKAAPPPKWYDKWWVWTAGAVGVAVVVTAVAVPVSLSQRDPVKEFNPSYTYTITPASK
jgi:hypothetical protein